MSLFKFSEFIANKYSSSEIDERKFLEIKQDLLDSFRNYIASSSKDPVIAILSNSNHKETKSLVDNYNYLIAEIDNLSKQSMFDLLKKILDLLLKISDNSFKDVNNYMHDALPGVNTAIVNQRNVLKQKFSKKIEIVFRITQKCFKSLGKMIDESILESDIKGVRRNLSSREIMNFVMISDLFDSEFPSNDLLEKLLEDNYLREKLTTVINSIKRGYDPKDAPALKQEIVDIENLFKSKLTNQYVFELDEDQFKSLPNTVANLAYKISSKYKG